MKTGLVLEGGAMRGLFSAGVLDFFLEQDVGFHGAMGVSAGACFGCNLKSRQKGRALRYNLKYAKDWRFCSIRSLLTTGDLFGGDFCYRRLPYELDRFDFETYQKDPLAFYAVCTDVHTGKAVYPRLDRGEGEDLTWMRASASMPLVSRPVAVGQGLYLDGGIADPIPLKQMEEMGYVRNLVILTRPEGYEKKKSSLLPAMKPFLHRYPALYEAMKRRHEVYNESLRLVKMREKEGKVFVLCPKETLPAKRTEKDPRRLQATWEAGYSLAKEQWGAIQNFLKMEKKW